MKKSIKLFPRFSAGDIKDGQGLYDNSSLKVVIIGCVAIVAALIIMSISSMLITSNAVVSKLKNSDLKNLAQSNGALIEGRIDRAVDASRLLANDPILRRWVSSGESDLAAGEIVKVEMAELIRDFGYDTAFIVDARTLNYWSYHDRIFERLDIVSPDDPSDAWFFKTMTIGKKYEINIDPNKQLKDTFVWINVLMGDINSPQGICGLGMRLDQVIGQLVQTETQDSTKNDLWLVDGQGRIYLSKDPRYQDHAIGEYLPPELTKTILKTGNSLIEYQIAEYENDQDQTYDIAYKNIRNTGWKLVVQIPRAESLSFLKMVTVNTVITCLIIILIMVLLFYILSYRIADPFKRALELNRELENKVVERTRELQEKNTKIQDSIEYAKMIQDAILPDRAEMSRALADYFVILKPRDIVGGDFYWLRSDPSGYFLAVGDCTGHGVPGALMTTAVNAMLNHIFDTNDQLSPASVLTELDQLIKKSFRAGTAVATVQYGLDAGILYICPGQKIIYSGANFSLLVNDANGIHEIKGQSRSIDCLQHQSRPFENHTMDYPEARTLYLATDGISSQPGGERQLPYGKSRLMATLAKNGHLPMAEQAAAIEDAFSQYAGSQEQRDDMTIIGFRL